MRLNVFSAKKIRIILAVIAFAGCTAAFASDVSTPVQASSVYGYHCDDWGHGHHHG